MKKPLQLKVISIGKPDLQSLSKVEQNGFYSTLLDRLKEICANENNTDTKPVSD